MRYLFVMVIALLVSGCTTIVEIDEKTALENQEIALLEYLNDNGILEEPEIIESKVQIHDELPNVEVTGIIKFKFENSKKIQRAKCFSVTEKKLTKYTINMFCEGMNDNIKEERELYSSI